MILSMQPWRLIKSPPSDAFTNMATDEAIFHAVSKGSSPPTVRFYSWSPPAISVGYFQDSIHEVNISACSELGIDVVRRLTGGRAVLHDRELTYSVICPEDDPHFPDNILGTYKLISNCLIRGLNSIGLNALLSPLVKKGSGTSSSACFASPSNYELTVNGKKLVGSAQRRGSGVFLQHGSILIECDREKLKEVLPGSEGFEKITSISEHLQVNQENVISSLTEGFEKVLAISFTEGRMTDEEMALSQKYRLDRYSRWEWNYIKPSKMP